MKKNENKVTEAFTELMIKKLQTIQADWKQPWVNIGFTGMPRNINGRHYNGMNSLMLMMLREEQGYQTPVFMTFRQAKANGWDVKKGEKGFPVELWRQIYKDENGKKISYEEFSNLSESEQQKCTSYPVNMTYIVFNAQQTRMPEVAPEKYQELLDAYAPGMQQKDEAGMTACPELDFMLENKSWLCSIDSRASDNAYYSISKDEIVIPLKTQFHDGERFYSTLLHEMAHSTGAENRLDRLKQRSFGSKEYGREELVAEMTAAMMGGQLGFSKFIKEDSLPYLKSWLKSLKEEPEFIRTIMSDVNKACNMIQENVMNPELAEEMKQKAIASIDRMLEKKLAEKAENRIPVVSQDELMRMTPSIKEAHESTLEKIDPAVIQAYERVKEKNKELQAWVMDEKKVWVLGEDALRIQKALKLPITQGLASDGETMDMLSFDRTVLDTYLPQAVRQGVRIHIIDAVKQLNQQQHTIQDGPKLHYAHLGNGISAWEEGDNEYTAFISPQRELKMYKEFSEPNQQKLHEMAEKGNLIVGNKGSEYLALQPLNMATKFLFQPYGSKPLPLSVEQVGDRQVICHRQQLLQPKENSTLRAEDYPDIQRPDHYLVAVTGVDEIRRTLTYMQKAGIDTSELQNGGFFEELDAAKAEMKWSDKEFYRIYFEVMNESKGKESRPTVVSYNKEPARMDPLDVLPRFYMEENAMLHRAPTEQQMLNGLSMECDILAQNNYVRVNGRDNVLDAVKELSHLGVAVTNDMKEQMQKIYDDGQTMPRMVAERDKIYLHITQGVIHDVTMNLSEYSIDDEPLREYVQGKIQKANLYEPEMVAAYLITGHDKDGNLLTFSKVLPQKGQNNFQMAQENLQQILRQEPMPHHQEYRLYQVSDKMRMSTDFAMADIKEMKTLFADRSQEFQRVQTEPVRKNEQQTINHINQSTMAKKTKTEEAQVQEPEVKQTEQQAASNEQPTKKELRDGVQIFQARDKAGELIPGVFRVMVVKEGVKSEVATLNKEDRDRYFQDIKDKKGEEAEAVRKAVADKYISPDGKRIEPQKATFTLRHASEENAQRIEEAKVYKRTDNGMYAVRCKIDGEQQMSRTFDTQHKDPKIAEFNKKLLDAFFDGFKELDKDAQMQRRIDVAAIKFNDVLTAEKQELSKGMSR